MSEQNRKTALEKATEAKEKAERKVDNLVTREARIKAEHDKVTADLADARADFTHAASHPLLQPAAGQEQGQDALDV